MPEEVKQDNSTDPYTSVVLVLANVLIVLMATSTAFLAFTRSIPVWLQWAQIGALTLIILPPVFGFGNTAAEHSSSRVEKWLHRATFGIFLLSLYGLMLLSDLPFLQKVIISGLGFLAMFHGTNFLIRKLNERRRQRLGE